MALPANMIDHNDDEIDDEYKARLAEYEKRKSKSISYEEYEREQEERESKFAKKNWIKISWLGLTVFILVRFGFYFVYEKDNQIIKKTSKKL